MKKKRIVIKIGTAVLTDSVGILNVRVIRKLVDSVSKLLDSGAEIMIVTSGAIGAGRGRIKLHGHTLQHKQALASIGQAHLMNIYDSYFKKHKRLVAQILLTRDDLEDKKRYLNAKHTIEELLKLGVVPIINENDTVAIDEIKFGDNDILSAEVAVKMKADRLIILTDVDGFCPKDPHIKKGAKPIREVKSIKSGMKAWAGGAGSQRGTGGMISKIRAMEMATNCGIVSYIANGRKQDVLLNIWQGKSEGTKFLPRSAR